MDVSRCLSCQTTHIAYNVYKASRVVLPIPSSSPRLRRLVIRSIGFIGHQEFEKGEVENFVGLLDRLGVGVGDVDPGLEWTRLLMGVIKSPVARDRLSFSYWELLSELVHVQDGDHRHRLDFFTGNREDGLEDGTQLLFRQRLDHVQKFEGWVDERFADHMPISLQRIREYGRLEVEQRSVSR